MYVCLYNWQRWRWTDTFCRQDGRTNATVGHKWTNMRTPHRNGTAGWVSSNAADRFFFRYTQRTHLCIFYPAHGLVLLPLARMIVPNTNSTLWSHARFFCRLPWHVYSRFFFVVFKVSTRFSFNFYPLPLDGSCHCGKRFDWSTPLPWGWSQVTCITKFCMINKCSAHIRAHYSVRKEQKCVVWQ
jgi:hypothetical protein